jgi:hypothetical protein
MLKLGFDLQFADLYRTRGLHRVDEAFLAELALADVALWARLIDARKDPAKLPPKEESALLIALAPHLEDFIGKLFGVREEISALQARHHELAPLFSVKRQFIQRKAAKAYDAAAVASFDGPALAAELCALTGAGEGDLAAFELTFARHVTRWQAQEASFVGSLELALKYAAWALLSRAGQHKHAAGVLFKAAKKIDPLHLVDHAVDRHDGTVTTFVIKPEHIRRRDGFKLTDAGTDLTGALDQANYCIWCHEQGKDSCSKGLK